MYPCPKKSYGKFSKSSLIAGPKYLFHSKNEHSGLCLIILAICYKSTSKRAGGPRLWGDEVVSASIHSALIPSKIIHANLLGKGRDPAGQVLVSWSETFPVAVHLRGYLEWVSVLRRYKKLFPKSPWHHGDSLTFP